MKFNKKTPKYMFVKHKKDGKYTMWEISALNIAETCVYLSGWKLSDDSSRTHSYTSSISLHREHYDISYYFSFHKMIADKFTELL